MPESSVDPSGSRSLFPVVVRLHYLVQAAWLIAIFSAQAGAATVLLAVVLVPAWLRRNGGTAMLRRADPLLAWWIAAVLVAGALVVLRGALMLDSWTAQRQYGWLVVLAMAFIVLGSLLAVARSRRRRRAAL